MNDTFQNNYPEKMTILYDIMTYAYMHSLVGQL